MHSFIPPPPFHKGRDGASPKWVIREGNKKDSKTGGMIRRGTSRKENIFQKILFIEKYKSFTINYYVICKPYFI